MNLFLRFVQFFRTDILWVATGQIVALIVGLLSLKIFTNLFSAEQYAYIALMMAMAAWIWTGLYQPLNQTIFRFYALALEQDWKVSFFSFVWLYEKRLAMLVVTSAFLLLVYGYFSGQSSSFILLVSLSCVMGISYGCVHGIVSFFLAQRQRKPVTLIQSTDGIFRLAGGLLAFYWFNQTEYATAVGLVAAGMIFSLMVLGVFRRQFEFRNVVGTSVGHIKYKQEFSSYFRKMFVVMILNASVIHLDKWLLFVLLGAEGMGKYAVVYMLAMTITTIMYVFFEMLGFPLIINRDSSIRRKQYLLLLLLAYAVCLLIIVTIIHLFGGTLLLFLTTDYVASEHESFTLLVVACGLLNFGRIAMVQGQVDKQPHRYWPAYLILLCFFISWCVLFVELGDGRVAAEGFVWGALAFVLTTVGLNLRKAKYVT